MAPEQDAGEQKSQRITPGSAIARKHHSYGGASGLLGSPMSAEVELGDAARGRCRHYRSLLHGTYGHRISLPLGASEDQPWCHHTAQGEHVALESSIYWSQETGAHVVQGQIRDHWMQLGAQQSDLGYPITDEMDTPEQLGRMTRFQRGEIWWYPDTGPQVRP